MSALRVRLWLLGPLAILLVSCQSTDKSRAIQPLVPRSLSIMQGSTDSTSTVLNIVMPRDKTYMFTVLLDSAVLSTPPLREKTWGDSPWKVVSFQLVGLNPGSVYDLKVADEKGELIDDRTFKTFRSDLKNPSVAVISCLDDQFEDLQKNQWREVWYQKPDALFLIGDNVYVDRNIGSVTDKEIWRRYLENRANLELYKMKTLIPVFATWDDHDYGSRDGDSRFAYKTASREIFKTFFPMEEGATLKPGPGVSSAVTIGKQNFVFFDNRSFRTANGVVPGDSHLGKEQESWFFNFLRKKKGPFWLIDGGQFFGGYHKFESFEGNHPTSFKNFLARLKTVKKTFVFISGDRHLAEIMKIPKKTLGYETYEFTSSGLHATMYPGTMAKSTNPKQVFGQDGLVHFLMIRSEAVSPRRLKLDATYYGERSVVLHRKSYEVTR